jgi:hypothetical protein
LIPDALSTFPPRTPGNLYSHHRSFSLKPECFMKRLEDPRSVKYSNAHRHVISNNANPAESCQSLSKSPLGVLLFRILHKGNRLCSVSQVAHDDIVDGDKPAEFTLVSSRVLAKTWSVVISSEIQQDGIGNDSFWCGVGTLCNSIQVCALSLAVCWTDSLKTGRMPSFQKCA